MLEELLSLPSSQNDIVVHYYQGVLIGLEGTKYEKRTIEFLKARNIHVSIPKTVELELLKCNQNFRRGCFESCGDFHFDKEGRPIVTCSKLDNLKYEDVNALDFLGLLYDDINVADELFDYTMYAAYKRLCQHTTRDVVETNIHYKRINPNAIKPFKEKTSDAGYEINVIRKTARTTELLNRNTELLNEYVYDTGLIINPPFGYYFEVTSTKMLLDKGYTVVNTIIERSTSTSTSPTVKVIIGNPKSCVSSLELPFPAIRIIPKHIEHFSLVEDCIHRIQ